MAKRKEKEEVERPGFQVPELIKPPKDSLPEGALTAAALLELSDTLKAGLRNLGARTPALGARILPAIYIAQIPVSCAGVYDAIGYGTGDATRRAGSLSSSASADQAGMAAYDDALQVAKDNAKSDLDETFAHVSCESPCSARRGTVTYEIVSADVDASYGAFWAWVAYTWTIKVKAKEQFKCV